MYGAVKFSGKNCASEAVNLISEKLKLVDAKSEVFFYSRSMVQES